MGKTFNSRIVNKNDTSENWLKAGNFIPLKGEIIVYTDLKKIKIGDGVTNVSALDFVNGSADNTPGLKTAEGGEIFNDYDTNQATAEFATAFGTQTIAAGKASLAQGSTVFKSGSEYITNSNKLVYVISKDCKLAISEGEGKYEVITQEELETLVGYPCIETADGGFVPASDLRTNEAIGTGSFAGGMGAVAYSRASKSLGYRTQTGYPPNAKLAAARPECLSIGHVDITNPISIKTSDEKVSVNCEEKSIHISKPVASNPSSVEIDYPIASLTGKDIPISFVFEPISGLRGFNGYMHIIITLNNNETVKYSNEDIFGGIYENGLPPCRHDCEFTIPGNASKVTLKFTDLNFMEFRLNNLIIGQEYPAENIGQAAVAIGADTVALNNHAFAGGLGSKAIGANSMAFGGYNETQTQHSVALGFKNKVLESNDPKNPYYASIALGYQNTANGSFQAVLGNNNISSKTSSQTIVGKYNAYENGVIDDAIFVVGNGKHNTARSNAFTIDVNGNATLGGELSVETIKGDNCVLSLSNGILDFVGTRIERDYIHSYDINCHNLLFGDGQTVLSEVHDDNESKHYLTTSTGIDANGTIKAAGLNITGKSNIGYGLRTPSGTLADGKSNNVALGWSCQANDSCAFAVGSETQANAYASTAFGSNSIASAGNSFVAGKGLKTGTIEAQTVVGKYNKVTNDAMFVVGNGTSDTARSNALVVNKDGSVKVNGTLSFNSLDSASLQIIVDAVRAALPNAEEASF